MKFSKYHLSTDELSDVEMPNKRIIFSTRTATSILIEENIYQLAINNEFDNIDKEIYKTLVEKEFIVNAQEDEYQYVMSTNATIRDTVNFLSMTIQPSANCQLGCHYCGQTHTKDYAKEDVIEKYLERIEFLLNGKDIYNGLAITWYGGEPLTGYSSIKKASKKMIHLCKEKAFTYISDMITNGLSLKPKLFEELVKECGVTQYQITIDGTAESHDTRRITKTGEPTFDLIMQNIVDVTNTSTYKDYGCNISIRVNIDKTNYQFVEPLIDCVREMHLQDKISMYFATIVDFGGNDAGKESLTKEFFAQKEIEWLFKCYENNISVDILPKRSYSVCMVEQKDSEVWDAFGNIYACWEFPYSETYGKGDSLIGNLFNPKETYNMDATLRDWSTVLDSGTTWCKTCLHLPVCGGGCPKSWHEGTPACPPFKSNFKDKLLLDYYIRQKKKKLPKFKITYQLDEMDCGPSCLVMIAKHYGKEFSLPFLREHSFITKNGVSLLGISQAAQNIGFETISAKLTLEKLIEKKDDIPCIVHWNQSHFAVLYEIKKNKFSKKYYFYIADPAHGLIRITEDNFCKGWTSKQDKGVALFLTPTETFFNQQEVKEKNNFSYLFNYIKPYKWQMIKIFISLILGSLITLIFPFLTQNLVDKGINTKDIHFVTLILLAQLSLFFGHTIIEIIRNKILLYVGSKINISIIADFLGKLMLMPLKYFDAKRIGDLTQRIQDHKRIESFLTSQSIQTLFSLINFSVFFGYLHITIGQY